jgi:hypothetical protein
MVLLFTVSSAGCVRQEAAQSRNQNRGQDMSIDELIARIRQNRPEAQAIAARLGPQAAPAIVPLTDDPDPQIRAAALLCLGITGGDPAPTTALKKLQDSEDEVVLQALQVLRKHPPIGREEELLRAFKNPSIPAVREELPLVAGGMTPRVDPKPWRNFWEKEGDPQVKESLMVALARMGDVEAREQFVKHVLAARRQNAVHWIDYCKYMEDRWIVRKMVPLLSREDVVFELMPDADDNKWPIRVCDLAVKAIVEITRAKVSFDVQRPTQFTPAEIDEVRGIAGK